MEGGRGACLPQLRRFHREENRPSHEMERAHGEEQGGHGDEGPSHHGERRAPAPDLEGRSHDVIRRFRGEKAVPSHEQEVPSLGMHGGTDEAGGAGSARSGSRGRKSRWNVGQRTQACGG